MSLTDDIIGIGQDFQSAVTGKPIVSAVVGSVAVGAVGVGVVKAVKARKKTKKKTKKSTKKKKTTKKRKTKGRKLKFGSKAWRKKYLKKGKKKTKRSGAKYARTAGKGKDTSTRRIRMTKNGQPYVILASGKARFIKRSSARRSRKLKGGRY